MSEINLDFLKKTMPSFRDWLKTEEGTGFANDRAKKDFFVKSYLVSDALDHFDEGALRDLVSILWSFGGWTNKDWLVNQMLQSGIEKVRLAFKTLLYSNKPLAERFDYMRSIDRMGAATVSEILAHFDHDKYPIWNKRAKGSLIKMGISAEVLPKISQITGSQYENYIKVVKPAFEKVKKAYPEINDLLMFDFLLYYISILIEVKAEKKLLVETKFDHDATIEHILQLGDSLGFDVQKEYNVTSGCRIDAIWKSRVANLGTITYAFEVHNKGSRDSAILNLQRVFNADPTVQKTVIVATDDELAKFKEEIAALKGFKDAVGYFPVKNLEEALIHQEALKRILASIGLMKTRTQ